MSSDRTIDIAGNKIISKCRSLIEPAEPDSFNGTSATYFNFIQKRNGYAIDLVVDNMDALNNLKVQINNNDGSTGVITLAPNSVLNMGDVKIVSVNILAGSTNWQVLFNIVRAPTFK